MQWPILDITCSSCYQIWAPVDQIKSFLIYSVRDNIAEICDLHHIGSDTERVEFIDPILADNKYPFPVVEHVEGGVCAPNATLRVSNAANKWQASTELSGGSHPTILRHHIISSGE
jgi:hypothetical protein